MRARRFSENYIIDKYILREFISPFFFSLLLFICISLTAFVLFNLIELMLNYGLSPAYMLKIIIFSLPEMTLFSIPMAVLLASILSAGRLYRDNEFLVILMGGKSVFRIFSPLLAFISIICILSLFLSNSFISKSNSEYLKTIYMARYQRDIPINKLNVFFKEYHQNNLKRSFYASRFIPGKMFNPLVEEFEDNRLISIISAESAEFINQSWEFRDGRIYNLQNKDKFNYISFSKYRLSFSDNMEEIIREMRGPREMSYSELKKHIENLKSAGENTAQLETQLFQKTSLPFTPLSFFFAGIPLGLSPRSKSSAFGFSFSLIFIFFYYLLFVIFTAIGANGWLSPLLAAYFPNLIILTVGLSIFLRRQYM